MSKTTQPLLHHAEELGQSREYSIKEAQGIVMAAIFCGAWGAVAAVVLAVGYWLYGRSGLTTVLGIGVLAVGAGLIVGGIVLRKGIYEQLDGLRTWREVKTYQPVQPQSEPVAAHPPILVNPPGRREPYLLTEPEMPGRETLRLTPPVIAEILQGVIERYDGSWSRRKLTRLRIAGGQKVSRSVYEQLTAWLHRSGVLEQTAQGGFRLLAQDLDDLHQIFPGLPVSETGQVGGEPGSWASDSFDETQPDREVITLAERRRREWLECNCDTRTYLERGGDGS